MEYEILANRRRLGKVGDKINIKEEQAAVYLQSGLIKPTGKTAEKTKEKAKDVINEGPNIK